MHKLNCKCKHFWSAAGERSLGICLPVGFSTEWHLNRRTINRGFYFSTFNRLINGELTNPCLQTRMLPYMDEFGFKGDRFSVCDGVIYKHWCLSARLCKWKISSFFIFFLISTSHSSSPSTLLTRRSTFPTLQRLRALLGRADSRCVRCNWHFTCTGDHC